MSTDVLFVLEQVESYLDSWSHARLNALCIVDLVEITKFLLDSFTKQTTSEKCYLEINDNEVFRYDTLINLLSDYKEKHSLR